MTSLSNLTSAKVRRFFLIAALVVCPFLAVQNGNAQAPVVTGSLLAGTTTGGPFTSQITITQNQQFFLQLQITTNFLSSGITYFLQSNNGSGFFQVVGRDRSGSPYPDATTSDGAYNFTGMPPGNSAGLLNPVTDFDLGATNNGSDTSPAGTYTIALLTMNTLNAPPGQYTIFIDRGVVTDRTGGGFEDRAFTAMATINVVPEPTTVAFAVIGGGMLLVAGYRKHRRSKAA